MSEANQGAPEVNQPVTPEARDAALAAKFDKAQADAAARAQESGIPKPDAPQKPEGIPDKFWNAETGEVDYAAMAKSYTELEKKLSTMEAVKAPADQAEADAQAQQASDALQLKGLDLNEFSKEFAEKGELTPESYEKLQKAGFPKELVDGFIAGQQALRAQQDEVGYAEVGGKEAYKAMAEWASVNLTPAEREAYNKALMGGPESMKMAVRGLRDRYQQANGSDPKLLGGNRGTSETAFQSRAEMTAAMKDPRYKKDPAYRAMVARKLADMAW